MNNSKLTVYKIVFQEVCKEFYDGEEFIKNKIEDICSNGKLSVQDVTYLFMNDYGNF